MKCVQLITCLWIWMLAAHPGIAATLGVIGDSLSTGAASHAGLNFEADVIWSRLTGNRYESESPDQSHPRLERIAPTHFEFRGGFDWVGRNFLFAVMSNYFDFPELSWVGQLSSDFRQSQSRILLAAEDGARVSDFRRQLLRLLRANQGRLPDRVVAFFSGNDICGPSLARMTSAEEFVDHLRAGMDMIMQASTGGRTLVYIPAYLSVQQVTQSESILQKEIRAHGRVMTCKELHNLPPTAWKSDQKYGDYAVSDLLNMIQFPVSPRSFCPTLFGANLDNAGKEQIFTLTGRMRSFRQSAKQAVTDFNNRLALEKRSDLQFYFVEQTESLRFAASDISNDCFHLSQEGHKKVASVIENAFLGNATNP
jgi:hypothetical protein